MSFKLGCRIDVTDVGIGRIPRCVHFQHPTHRVVFTEDFSFFSFSLLVFSDQVTLELFHLFTASYGIMDRSSSNRSS